MFGINNKTEEYNVEFKNSNETEIEGVNEGKKIDSINYGELVVCSTILVFVTLIFACIFPNGRYSIMKE
ncbi:MAG: hypothetical protein LE180_00555 [Endomicrobium sp.]|uniref:hypothetical protein n=1 Tax=Candidatus Endomicrobiellum pyrsonymphae TaxID=1408203 RepID=UPI003583546D|nr:hypothetical protein [Endomicrobium sp.]